MKTKIQKILISLFITLFPIFFVHAKLPENITDRFPSTNIADNSIMIKAPDIAENGAVVTIGIANISKPNNLHVKEIWFFDHYRKQPIAHFKLGPMTIPDSLKSRFKLGGSSVVYAIALLSDGSMISGSKLIKVTIGGCGGGSVRTGQGYQPPSYIPPTSYLNKPYIRNKAPLQNQAYSHNSEKYATINTNGIVQTSHQPVSTFSIDVDTGSYSNVRRFLLQQGRLPVTNAVRVDAGDIGAGHTVTALYEIAFTNSKSKSLEPLRYASRPASVDPGNEIAYIRLRYKDSDESNSREIKHPIYLVDVQKDINRMSDNYRFASAVAAFGQLLRNENKLQGMNYEHVYKLAQRALGHDKHGYRKEFLDMIDTAASL